MPAQRTRTALRALAGASESGRCRRGQLISWIAAQRRPGLETANQVRGAAQPQPLQGMRGEAGTVPLVADDHDPAPRVVGNREPVGAGRIEPPLKHVAVDDDRSGKIAVPVPLISRPYVDNERPRCHFPPKVRRMDTLEAGAGLSQ